MLLRIAPPVLVRTNSADPALCPATSVMSAGLGLVVSTAWGGVAFTTLYELARPKPEARFVYFTGYDGYSTNVPLAACLDDDVLIATRFEGSPVPREHGGPARVIIPKLYAWKGSKFVKGITFLAEDKLGFWEVRGYSNGADPWTEDRYA